MSEVMGEEIERWTVRRKSALLLEIIQGKARVAKADPHQAQAVLDPLSGP